MCGLVAALVVAAELLIGAAKRTALIGAGVPLVEAFIVEWREERPTEAALALAGVPLVVAFVVERREERLTEAALVEAFVRLCNEEDEDPLTPGW